MDPDTGLFFKTVQDLLREHAIPGIEIQFSLIFFPACATAGKQHDQHGRCQQHCQFFLHNLLLDADFCILFYFSMMIVGSPPIIFLRVFLLRVPDIYVPVNTHLSDTTISQAA